MSNARVTLGRPARAAAVFEGDDGVPLTDQNASVAVTIASHRRGTTLVSDQAATFDTAGGWHVPLAADAVGMLDLLICTWTVTVDEATYVSSSGIEVAAAPLFPLSRARAHRRLAAALDQGGPALIERVRADAERALEERCGFAFVPRYTPVYVARLADRAVLDLVKVRALAAGRLSGQPLDEQSLAKLTVTSAGILSGLRFLAEGPLELGVIHGADAAPGGAEAACLLLADAMIDSSEDPRLVRRGSAEGDYEVFYSQDAQAGAFEIPAVEAFCRRVERRRIV